MRARIATSTSSVAALLLAVGSAWAPPARAQLRPPTTSSGAGGWAEVFDPERRMGRLYVQDGLARLVQAMGRSNPHLGDAPRYLLLDQALIRFERAQRRIPDDPELAYYTAQALTRWERPAPDGGTEHRVEEAIEAWHRLRRLAPDYLPEHVAEQLAMLHMRRHEFERAQAEYEAALRHAVPPTVELAYRFYLPAASEEALALLFRPLDPSNLRANLAEATMLNGDLPGAVAHYRRALESTESPLTRNLALWGLAVTLDRSGDRDGALRSAARAIREDPIPPDDPRYADLHREHGPFTILHLDGVFFEPPWEIHAYEAIGREALGRAQGADAQELRRALRSWRLFLAEGGTSSRFAANARAHAERLEAELSPPSGRAPRR